MAVFGYFCEMDTLAAFLLPLFILATCTQLVYWGAIFTPFAQALASQHRSSVPPDVPLPPVSIIICARNEADHLRRHLPLFLSQNYPEYELIVVNDHSIDESLQILLDIQNSYHNLAVVNLIGPDKPGKKAALSKGVEAARFESLVFSDADCKPCSPQWLQKMSAPLAQNHQLVLGFGAYQQAPGGLNRWQRFETVYTAIQYFSFTLLGIPYMGVGRNMAYRKTLFLRTGGLRGHAHLMSGDDDLFVNQAADPHQTTWVAEPEAFTLSVPTATWRGYYRQKQRHLSVGGHYRREHQWLLGLLSASHVAHYGLGLGVLAIQPSWWPILSGLFLARMAVVFLVWRTVSKQLQATELTPWIPILDFLLLGYYLLLAPVLFTGSRVIKQWK